MTESSVEELLERTAGFLARFVVFPSPEMLDAAALWSGYTWLYDQFDATPYLAIQSPEKGSGKTRLLECLRLLTRDPVPMAGATVAALFRLIDARHPTLLLDEADTIFGRHQTDRSEDLRGLVNNGYRRGIPFWRVVGEGKKMRVESFDVYCPKAIASIGALPDTIQDRSIVLGLKRRSAKEPIERFRYRRAELEAAAIAGDWKLVAAELCLAEDPAVPDELPDRAADNWEPLIALADAGGPAWGARARAAALELSVPKYVDDEKVQVLLLADIRSVLKDQAGNRISIKDLIEVLLSDAFEERPWQEWNNGRGLSPRGMGKLLRPFGIRARQLRVDGANIRGYEANQFDDTFGRYLPPDDVAERYTVTSDDRSVGASSGVALPSALARHPGTDLLDGREATAGGTPWSV